MIRRCGCPDASPSSICGLVDGSLRRYVVADERCLANIISILVLFLTSENRFIRHLTGNVLVAIFGYLDKIGHKWAEFLQLLWVTVEMAASNIHFDSAAPSSAGFNSIHADGQLKTCYLLTRDDTDIEIFVSLLRPRLIRMKFFMLTSLLQVLRNVLKSLKRKDSDHIDVYMYHGVSSLSKLPWNLLNQICADQTNGGVDSAESKGVFFGTLLQLICSLAEQNIVKEDMGSSFHDFPLLAKVIDLIPELLSCCFTGHVDHNRTCVSQYLRHKSLDDLLFEVLLQLLDVASPIWTEQYYKIVKSVEELNEGQLFHLPSIMNPVHLFHLFLSELQFDHLVLLDYLISKDTGLTCLQYLLRSSPEKFVSVQSICTYQKFLKIRAALPNTMRVLAATPMEL
ncbi:hypothetical protein QJS10_CPA05g01530 [Acorus calamus]|uniref:Protein Lines N-terminal domain-containing protein n=1 Tax=Acorus calamus TaxID=4465 RepID=A0AAV9EVP1_ACOCL|nr:hypothetical protein QJS10_CPA05g01530 [Acorus calamus]